MQYLIDNDRFFRMMTHFMLDGSLTREMIERLNEGERRPHHLQELLSNSIQEKCRAILPISESKPRTRSSLTR